MSCFIIPIPSSDNGNLLKFLTSNGFGDFIVTSKSYPVVVNLVLGELSSTSSSNQNIVSTTSQTAVVYDGAEKLVSQLSPNGYGDFTVTSQTFSDLVSKLFSTNVVRRQSLSPNAESEHNHSINPSYTIDDSNNDDSDIEPPAKRGAFSCVNMTNKACCQDDRSKHCEVCSKHVLPKIYSADNIFLHAFYHSKLMRFECLTCKLTWKAKPTDHICSRPNVVDHSTSDAPSTELVQMAIKCFPMAIENLKGKFEWTWN